MKRRTCSVCNGDVVYKKRTQLIQALIMCFTGCWMMRIPRMCADSFICSFTGWLAVLLCFIFAFRILRCPTQYFTRCKECGTFETISKKEYEEVTK